MDDLLHEGAVRTYLERCPKAVDPHTSVSPLIERFFTDKKNDAHPDDVLAKSNTQPTNDDMLHMLAYLGRCTTYPDVPGGPGRKHVVPLMALTWDEYRQVQRELVFGVME